MALYTRFRSQASRSFAEKMLSAMRMAFGGHVESHDLHVK
jgi:6-phosphogluconate dehydrogenase